MLVDGSTTIGSSLTIRSPTCSYTFILIARVISMVTGLHLRVRTEVEVGLDTLLNFRDLTRVQIGDFANDYIEVCRDVMEPDAVQMGRRVLTLDMTIVAGTAQKTLRRRVNNVVCTLMRCYKEIVRPRPGVARVRVTLIGYGPSTSLMLL